MYSTCLFCHGALGLNEAIEHFPIGRRLAFDSAKGRLWVVCAHCKRWNLTPLEERWEALEECERLFAAQRLRAQTEHIGLTKLKEGLELIRVGRPLRPEFAAWRYGYVFGGRLKRRIAWLGTGAAAAGGSLAVGLATGAIPATLLLIPPVVAFGGHLLVNGVLAYRDYLRTTYVPRPGQRPFLVFGANMKETDLAPGSGPPPWVLNFRHVSGTDVLNGDAARRALGVLMTRVNAAGAPAATTRAAAERIATAGGPESFVTELARASRQRTGDFRQRLAAFRRNPPSGMGDYRGPINRGALPYLALEERLALEMAVHEEEERRALEEEIGVLEAAWREAESIAAIADDLLTPPSARAFIARQRAGDGRSSSTERDENA